MEKRTDHLSMKIAPSVKEAARKAAQEEGRSVSNYIERLILDDAKKKGLV